MPTTFTITTDEADMMDRILNVIHGGKKATPKPAIVPTVEIAKGNSASPLPTPTMAAPPPAPAPEPAPVPVAPTNSGATVSQAAEACNAQMDIFLKQHKAAEAKMVLQKYGARRISDVTDVNVLHQIYREFGGQ